MVDMSREAPRSHPKPQRPDPALGAIRAYLQEKRRHLRYLTGNLRYYATDWPHNVIPLLYELSVKLLGLRLGEFRQYPPRELRRERFPVVRKAVELPSIAIVTPSYNQGHVISQTIASVLDQAYPRLEYAVVDGGSTDGTREVLDRYVQRLAYCVSEPDAGQADAVAKGFQHVQGEIMGYLNSDDMLLPGALRFVGEFFALHPNVDVIYGHRVIVDDEGQEVGRWILPPHDTEVMKYHDWVPQETLFWRSALYRAVGGIDRAFQFAMDWDLVLRFINAGARFQRVPYSLGCFRVHDRQKTHALSDGVGQREKDALVAREHSGKHNAEEAQKLCNAYALRSSLYAILLKCGIRH
jgi:Glycosyl transferase family 2